MLGLEAVAVGQPDKNFAAYGDGAAGVAVAFLAVLDLGFPDDLSGSGVKGIKLGVRGGHKHLVAIERQAARGAIGAGGRRPDAVLPQQLAGSRIQRLHRVGDIGQEHDAVMHDGRDLAGAAVIHRPGPDQLQVLHIRRGDLFERRIAPALIIAPVHQPVAIGGIAQHLVGDGAIVLDGAGHRQAKPRGGIRSGGALGGGSARRGRRRRGHRLAVRDGGDLHAVSGHRRVGAGPRAIGRQHIVDDLLVDACFQTVGIAIRHRGAHLRGEVGDRTVAPGGHEAAAGQRRGLARARQVGAVAGGAVRDIERPARRCALRGERPGLEILRQRIGAQHGDGSSGEEEMFSHRCGTSSCGKKPWPATGTASPAKGWGGSSQPVRLPSGAFWLSTCI